MKAKTEVWSNTCDEMCPGRAHGEATMQGTRKPKPRGSTWGGATWS